MIALAMTATSVHSGGDNAARENDRTTAGI